MSNEQTSYVERTTARIEGLEKKVEELRSTYGPKDAKTVQEYESTFRTFDRLLAEALRLLKICESSKESDWGAMRIPITQSCGSIEKEIESVQSRWSSTVGAGLL